VNTLLVTNSGCPYRRDFRSSAVGLSAGHFLPYFPIRGLVRKSGAADCQSGRDRNEIRASESVGRPFRFQRFFSISRDNYFVVFLLTLKPLSKALSAKAIAS
jgi:hypothetical protein